MYKLEAAFWFFDVNKIWLNARGNDENSIIRVRKQVNCGTIGLNEVKRLFTKYQKLIS